MEFECFSTFMSTLLKLLQMEDSRTSERKQIAMHVLETSGVNVSRHMCCWSVSLACFSARWYDDAWKLLRHVLPYELDTIYMTHTNPLPFHSPALRYITLQVAKSSAILEGDIDPNDLWGKGGIFDMAGRSNEICMDFVMIDFEE